jgi:hypothetical protein
MCGLPLAFPAFHSIAVFVLGLYSTYERELVAFDPLSLANLSRYSLLLVRIGIIVPLKVLIAKIATRPCQI